MWKAVDLGRDRWKDRKGLGRWKEDDEVVFPTYTLMLSVSYLIIEHHRGVVVEREKPFFPLS